MKGIVVILVVIGSTWSMADSTLLRAMSNMFQSGGSNAVRGRSPSSQAMAQLGSSKYM